MRRTNLIGARHRIWVWWLAVLLMGCGVRAEAQISILNVSYDVSRETGSLILIDTDTRRTVAAGMIREVDG